MRQNGARGVFELEEGRKVNSAIYRDQVLTGPLQEFQEESFGDLQEPIVMEDIEFQRNMLILPL